ncbi:MAG: hypothetical protein PHQ34_05530 [Methanothrix sp.]|nr:hypothetical protein [Methanothrix sp.]
MNLGALFGQESGSLRALDYLRRSNECDPQDPQTRERPRLRRFAGDIVPAQKHFPAVQEMEAPEDPRGLARSGLREMAACELKAKGSEDGWRSSVRLGTAALLREVAGGGPGDHLRDRDALAVRAGHQRSQGDARPAGAAGDNFLGATAYRHHVYRLSRGWI